MHCWAMQSQILMMPFMKWNWSRKPYTGWCLMGNRFRGKNIPKVFQRLFWQIWKKVFIRIPEKNIWNRLIWSGCAGWNMRTVWEKNTANFWWKHKKGTMNGFLLSCVRLYAAREKECWCLRKTWTPVNGGNWKIWRGSRKTGKPSQRHIRRPTGPMKQKACFCPECPMISERRWTQLSEWRPSPGRTWKNRPGSENAWKRFLPPANCCWTWLMRFWICQK